MEAAVGYAVELGGVGLSWFSLANHRVVGYFGEGGWVCCIGGSGWVCCLGGMSLAWRVSELSFNFDGGGWLCGIGDFGGGGWVCCRVWWSWFSLASHRVVGYSILAVLFEKKSLFDIKKTGFFLNKVRRAKMWTGGSWRV
jgi:hypothetical protein